MQAWRGSAVLLLGLGIMARAQTAGWGAFESAFPVLPCQDGWAGCVAYGQHVDPEMRRDGQGRAVPSDARIGWFDLQATAAFSPFTGLSAYEVESAGAVAAAEPETDPALPDPASPAPSSERNNDAVAVVDPPAPQPVRAAPPPPPPPRAPVDDGAAQRERELQQQREREKAEQERLAQERERQERLARMEQERLEKERAAAEAKRVADEMEAKKREEAARLAKEAEEKRPPVDGCQDLNQIEPYAAMGKLDENLVRCLETRVANDPKMTDKRNASKLLMADAWARSDRKGWEALVKRHLEDIDQSDPDLCFKYAVYLSQQGVGRASGVIRWSNVALENRMVWIGDEYTRNVYSLYKIRTAASQALWQQAEEEHRNAGTDESREKVEKFRNLTKVNAREWYEYARDAGKDAQLPLDVCMSAAGTADYCEAR